MRYREQLFFEWLKNDCSENDIWHLHALKGNNHGHFLNVNYNAEISTVALSQRDQRRVSSFNLRFQLVRASEAQKVIEAANATASSPGGK